MGDVGSTFLGAFFVGLLLHTPNVFDAFGLLLVASPLLADACLCVPRRFFNGENVFLPHRLHLFQRLHQAGWSHGRVSTIYILSTALLGFAYITGGLFAVFPLSIILLIIGFWLDQYIAVPFLEVKRN